MSAPGVGAAAPPPVDVPPVDVPPVPVEPVEPVVPLAPLVAVGVGVGLAVEPSSLLEEPDAGGASADCGIGTSE